MSPNAESLTAIRVEILKAFSALWNIKSQCWEARSALGRCIEHLQWRDLSCLPDVAAELELAHAALHRHPGASEALGCIARAALHVSSITNKNATRLEVA